MVKLLDIIDRRLKELELTQSVDRIIEKIAEIISEVNQVNGYIGINIMGSQGTGKTVLAMQILYRIYNDWDKVVDEYLFFDITEFLEKIHDALSFNNRIKAVVLDDFGLWASKWRRTSDVTSLLELMNVIRTVVGSVIYTYVDTSAQKFIRENSRIVILLERIDKERVRGKVYKRKQTIRHVIYKRITSFNYRPGKYFRDRDFREAYEKYWEKRRKVTLMKLAQITSKFNQIFKTYDEPIIIK